MVAVVERDEVVLYGDAFRIVGPIQRSLIDPFPTKVVFGDYSRDDAVVLSSWVTSDLSGGIGVQTHRPPDTNTRYSDGTLDTRFKNQLTLSPLITTRGNLTGITKMVPWRGTLYAASGSTLYKWVEGSSSWSSVSNRTSTIVDMVPAGTDRLYVSYGAAKNIEYYNGNVTWTDTGQKGHYLYADVGTSTTLWATQTDNTIDKYASGVWTNESPKMVEAANEPDNFLIGGFKWVDAAGDEKLYVITKKGLYSHETSSTIATATTFQFPYHPEVGVGDIWNGNYYLPVGASILRWKPDDALPTPVGPDLDEGLPTSYSGRIGRVVGTSAYLYAFVNGVSASTYGAILASSGGGWAMLYANASANVTYSAGCSFADDTTYRLWFATSAAAYSTEIPRGMHNPLRNGVATPHYQASGVLYTPWFNAKWPEQNKLALLIKVVAVNATATETILVEAQYDQENTWNTIGTVNSTGETTFGIEHDAGGKVFRKMRLRLTMSRDAGDTSKTPVLDSVTLEFIRRPKPLWSLQVTIDLTRPYKNRTPAQLRERLEEIVASEIAGYLYYRPEHDPQQTVRKLVLPGRAVSIELTGVDYRGRFPMSVIELEHAE
jgi:hypothetical protein